MYCFFQEEYGIDWEGPSGVQQDSVVVPSTDSQLTVTQFHALRRAVDPMEECDDYGIGLYTATRAFVYAV